MPSSSFTASWRVQIGSTQSERILQVVVKRLHRAIVERVARPLVLGAHR